VRYGSTFRATVGAVALAFVASCASVPVVKPGGGQSGGPQKVAVVLGGGGARGFAHVGVLRELEKEKVPIDLIVGVSVGSLVGALYADNGNTFDLEWKAFQIEKSDIFDLGILNLRGGSLAKGAAIREYIDQNIKAKNIEDLKIPMAIVAVDLRTGKRVVFTRGPLREAICASAAIPGVFAPVAYQGKLLVDGGVMGNLAPEVARELGATILIGANIAKQPSPFDAEEPGPLATILESIGIMGDELVRLKRDQFDVLIEPEVGNVGTMDFDHKKELLEAGIAAAQQEMPTVKALLQAQGASSKALKLPGRR
jgi:NTE family protein